jgi:magnesium transporter
MVRMNKFFRRRGNAIGALPGTPQYLGPLKAEGVRISVFDFDEDRCREKEFDRVEDVFGYKDSTTVTWINIEGVHDVEIIKGLGDHFDLHPLVLEDIANTWQRPKMEDFETYLFIVVKMLAYDDSSQEVTGEQVSLIMGEHYVISFQERPGDVFDNVRERIRSGKGRIRRMGPDYLMYSLLDTIVDEYFKIMERMSDHIEELEDSVVTDPRPEDLQDIHRLKREMIFLRKSVWPLRELIGGLERGESPLIQKATQRFLRDVYDHTIQVIDTVEIFRDMLSGMHDTYLSSLSNRMNEIMKVLTIIATIFIPVTFLAGIYGMNFEFMPELKWRWGYPAVWSLILAAGLGMVYYFRRKRWL